MSTDNSSNPVPGRHLKDRPTVYVAGPYSPDPVIGTRAAIEAADAIWDAGGAPYVPHLTHFWHFLSPKPYETWLELDLIWVSRCDMLVRLPGESSGADGEVRHAEQECLPVFHSLDDCLLFLHVGGDPPAVRRSKQKNACDNVCEWCAEGWPVHYANALLGWIHTQREELAAKDRVIFESARGDHKLYAPAPQVWHRCDARPLRDQYRKQDAK